MSQGIIDNLRRVFVKSKEKGIKEDVVVREDFLENIVEDAYFTDSKLEEIVRTSVDGATETLDALLLRVSETFKCTEITWSAFMNHFCRRGILRDSEKLVFVDPAHLK